MGGEFLLIHFFEQLSHQCINGCAQSSLVRHIFLIIQKFESLNTNLVREGVISTCLVCPGTRPSWGPLKIVVSLGGGYIVITTLGLTRETEDVILIYMQENTVTYSRRLVTELDSG